MPDYDVSTPTTPWQSVNAGVIPVDVYGVAINQFINRTPLTARLPKLPCGSDTFKTVNDNYRPRSLKTTAAYTTGTSTALTFADATSLQVGDVLNVENEYFLVTAAHATAPTVTGAYAGSTGANHASGKTAYLITNTRTGAEVDIAAISRIPALVEQYCQTIQHAVSVGGSLQANASYVGAEGSTPLQRDLNIAVQHVMDDFEDAVCYGVGVKRAGATTRPAMKGLATLIATNNVASPTNASAYKPDDFIRDTVQKCFDGGGEPDLLVVSTEFLSGFSIWGNPAVRVDAGSNAFGTSIDLFHVPFLSGINVIVSSKLRPYSALCLQSSEVRLRMKRPMFVQERGRRGDAVEADVIMEGAVQLDNEPHHAYVTNITAFAKAS